VVVNQPVVALALALAGLAVGVVLSAATLACLEPQPAEFVRFTDAQGVTRTVPYVRPTPSAATTAAAAAAQAVPATNPAQKKAE